MSQSRRECKPTGAHPQWMYHAQLIVGNGGMPYRVAISEDCP